MGAWTRGVVSADSRGYAVVNELRGSLLTPCIQICFSRTKRQETRNLSFAKRRVEEHQLNRSLFNFRVS